MSLQESPAVGVRSRSRSTVITQPNVTVELAKQSSTELLTPIAKAKTKFLDPTIPLTSIFDLSAEFDLTASEIHRVSLEEGWLDVRRRNEEAHKLALSETDVKAGYLVDKAVNDVAGLRIELLLRDVRLIETRQAKLIAYLDEKLLSGTMTDKTALTYLKLLTDISARIQDSIDNALQNQGKVDQAVTDALKGLNNKIQILQGLDLADGVETNQEVVDANKEAFKKLDGY